MMSTSPWWAGLGLLAAALLAWGLATGRAAAANETLVHGPFEIVAEERRESDGSFPNTSANPFRTVKVVSYRVRHRGREVQVVHGDRTLKRFWHALRLVDAPRPALLVSTHEFHLLTEDADGRLLVRSIGEPSTNFAELQWLDAGPGGQPAPTRRPGGDDLPLQAATTLQGGRLVRLSFHSVLDIQRLQVHAVRPWTPYDERGAAQPRLHGAQHEAVAMAPGGSAYAVSGHGRDASGHYDGLLVVDLATGDATPQRIDPRRTPRGEGVPITPAWVAQHFAWTRDARGHERLVPKLVPKAGG